MTRAVQKQAEWLADKLASQDRKIANLASRGELAHSSIEDGAIVEKDLDGNLVASVGKQHDGSHVQVPYVGPTPATPVAASLKAVPGVAEVRWSGKFTGDAVSAMDFKHVAVHVSRTPAVDATPGTQVATIRGELGDVATVTATEGMLYVVLVAWSAAGKFSDPSPVAAVAVPGTVDAELLDGTLADIQTSIDGKTSIHNSVEDAVPGDYADGDRWQKWTTLDPGGKLLASWRYTAGVWVAESMAPTYLPLIDIAEGTFGDLTGGRLVAGSVTAPLLESQLVLTTDIIAGNPAGTHAKLNPNGIRVLASTDGNEPTEVVRLGTETNDYIGVVDPATGNLSAAINSTGDITGQSMTIAKQINLGGEDLGERIHYMPQQLTAWAQIPINNTTMKLAPGQTEVGLYELGWDSDQGVNLQRMYEFKAHEFMVMSSVSGIVGLRLRLTIDGSAPTVNSGLLGFNYVYCLANNYATLGMSRLVGSNNGNFIRVLVCLYSGAGGTVTLLNAAGQTNVFGSVQDLGGTVPGLGQPSLGGGPVGGTPVAPPTDPKVTVTKDFNATGFRSFVGSGGTYAYNTGYMYSGLSPAGYGDLSSMAVFPSFTSLLSGATVNDIWVYVYYDFWYQGSGGYAYFSLHGQSALTTTKPSSSGAVGSGSWPRAAGRWVRLPDSTYAGFKSGAYKGFMLGGVGGGYERYGYAHDPKIRIRYTK